MAATPNAERMLPATASSLRPLALLGLLAVIGAFALRETEKRVQQGLLICHAACGPAGAPHPAEAEEKEIKACNRE